MIDKVKLDIVIVNWNSGNQLKECLNTIIAEGHNYVVSKVVIVDNASSDDSLNDLHDSLLPIEIIRNTQNKGFGAACNQGASVCEGKYLLFLNPDTRLLEDSLKRPVEFMETVENHDKAVCSIKLIDDTGNAGRSCTRLPSPGHFFVKILGLDRLFPKMFRSHFMTEWDHNDNRIVDHVIGAFYFVRRDIFIKVGRFDERFFVYLEDLDLSNRIKSHGYKIQYLADVEAYHKGGGTSEQVKATRLFYSIRSRVKYGFKHFGKFSAILLFVATYTIEPFARLTLALLHRSRKEAKEIIEGYVMLIKDMTKRKML